MQGAATVSACGLYRYALSRRWSDGPRTVLFIGLNPSKADDMEDDPTLRRCVSFARAWGYDALALGNLFAYRSKLRRDLRGVGDPVGPDNDRQLLAMAAGAHLIVAAWGNDGAYQRRGEAVLARLQTVHCLRLTRKGHPAHPLYLPAGLQAQAWQRG